MVGNIIFIRFQALVAAGIVSMFAVVSLPALSQDTEGEGESNLIESTITGDVDPSQAVTVEDLTIPIDQLELLIKPLTVEELQVEAAAWLLLLKNKVQEISTTEIAIKAEKEATEKGEDKEQLLVNVTKLQGQLTAIIDRFNVVLDALENKGK
jgi:small conductance mechanosensitive channel